MLFRSKKAIIGIVIGCIMMGCAFIPASKDDCVYIYEGEESFRDIGEYNTFLTAVGEGPFIHEFEPLNAPLFRNVDNLWKEEGVYREPKRVYFKVACQQNLAFPYGERYPIPQSLSLLLLFTIGFALTIISTYTKLFTRGFQPKYPERKGDE